MDVYFVTGNENKVREAEQILGMKLNHRAIELDELQEMDADKISEHKVRQAWSVIKAPLFVSDMSLHIDCLNGFPGPLVKWFWTTVSLEKICKIAGLLGNKGITAKNTLTYFDGKTVRHFYGTIRGTIPSEPRGNMGFGWDPVFVPEGKSKTYAEMTAEEKSDCSAYRSVLLQLKPYLK